MEVLAIMVVLVVLSFSWVSQEEELSMVIEALTVCVSLILKLTIIPTY